MLCGIWNDHIDRDLCEYLIHVFLDRNPSADCIKIGNAKNWEGLPDRKRLDKSPKGYGLVIGDILSQLISNILLNEYDQFVKRKLHCKHYGHYVDDIYHMHQSKDWLLKNKPLMVEFLQNILHLKVNTKKCRLIKASHANVYLGSYIRPKYKVPGRKIIQGFVGRIHEADRQLLDKCPNLQELGIIRNHVNAYLGLLGHTKSSHLRKQVIDESGLSQFYDIGADYLYVSMK